MEQDPLPAGATVPVEHHSSHCAEVQHARSDQDRDRLYSSETIRPPFHLDGVRGGGVQPGPSDPWKRSYFDQHYNYNAGGGVVAGSAKGKQRQRIDLPLSLPHFDALKRGGERSPTTHSFDSISTPPSVSPPLEDSNDERESDAPKIRIRRVGALGISVSSGSERDDEGGEEGSGSMLGDSSSERRRRRRRSAAKGGGSEGWGGGQDFRTIVDDLSIENQALKARLRRYEAAKIPTSLKHDRLFEIRYFDALSDERRSELQSFLTDYVRTLSGASSSDTRSTSPPEHSSTHHDSAPPTLLPIAHPPPIIPDRPPPRPRRRHEREMLAGPSNSGLEPPSFSGTGAAVQIDPPSGTNTPSAPPSRRSSPHSSLLLGEAEQSKGVEVIQVLEQLFEHATDAPSDAIAPGSGTNEAYLRRLLSQSGEGGWVYLNLVCTMAQLHRFSVSQAFVQSAIRALSQRIEISKDGTKIRWIGPTPSPPDGHSPPALSRNSSDDTATTTSTREGRNHQPSTIATSLAPDSLHEGAVNKPEPNVLGTEPAPKSVKLPQYIPFFERLRMEYKMNEDRDEGSEGSVDDLTDAGTLVFYGNGLFCSDLGKNLLGKAQKAEEVVMPLGLEEDVAGAESRVGGSDSPFRPSSPLDSALTTLDGVIDLKLVDGEEGGGTFLPRSSVVEDDLKTFAASGMTEVVPADLFSLVVTTQHPTLSNGPSIKPRGTKRRAEEPLAKENEKTTTTVKRARTRIVSTSTVQHVPSVIRRVPLSPALSPLSGNSTDGSGPSPSPPLEPFPAPLPESPDYLLSLSLPLFSWAPARSANKGTTLESGLTQLGGVVTDSLRQEKKRVLDQIGGGGEGGGSGSVATSGRGSDERPIDLDAMMM